MNTLTNQTLWWFCDAARPNIHTKILYSLANKVVTSHCILDIIQHQGVTFVEMIQITMYVPVITPHLSLVDETLTLWVQVL